MEFAEGSADVLYTTAALESRVELENLSQTPPEALAVAEGVVGVLIGGTRWSAQVAVVVDRSLLLMGLDAMYGGDTSNFRPSAPARGLTSLERSLAASFARAIISRLGTALGLPESSVECKDRVIEEIDQLSLGGVQSEYVVAVLRLVGLGARVLVAVPVSDVDRAAERRASSDRAEPKLIDSGWTEDFKRNIAATRIILTATMDGPRMPLSSIARLAPGSLIEFSGDAMRNVHLTTGGLPVFVGRLGQSRGLFTLLLERPAETPGSIEEPQ
jgi:flagellar motor switch protein FliM